MAPTSMDGRFDAIVNEAISEAHLNRALLLPEEIDYIREHALHKPLGVIHIWALGVGVVITGMYFGWNFGLPVGGPMGVLVASLVVCVLYLAWVLALSELSVAMPFAGGPLAFGRRAVGKWFGFLMGWSMFLESLFATIGTGLAAGGYIAFLIRPDHPDKKVTTACAIFCALLFLMVQYSGAKHQAVIMLWLTYAAIGALIWFWIGAAPGVSAARVFTRPLLPSGWSGVLGCVPYALWWLVIIETVALAAEEAHDAQVSIPRGLVLAQITLVALVMLTWWFASAAAPYMETGAVDYPLPLVFKKVWGSGWFLTAFSTVAVAGMLVSYNGMIYATSRQSFSLGRAGYLPRWLGTVHPKRRTPDVSLAVWTGVTILFIIFGYFYEKATAVAILISTLTAVIWYVLAMVCLLILRRKEPAMFRPYKVPVYPSLPVFVALLAGIAGCLYVWSNVQVIVPTALLYAAAVAWYVLWARKKVLPVAPEEVAARIAEELEQKQAVTEMKIAAAAQDSSGFIARATAPILMPTDPLYAQQMQKALERIAGPAMMVGILSLAWMLLRGRGAIPGLISEKAEVASITLLWGFLFVLISAIGLLSARNHGR
ncbi:MAG: amino acid permease [Bryobacteraceae bacterium]